MAWTDERVELLKKLWNKGLSGSQIAGRLGSVTSNAVIAKVHRLGLSGRAKTSRMKTHRPRPIAPPPAKKPIFECDIEPFVPQEELVIPSAERKTLQELEECNCRWPIGDVMRSDFHFCGKTKVAGLPYCEHHARRAFQPISNSKKTAGLKNLENLLQNK
jgi:GcrA cell cycle regulator